MKTNREKNTEYSAREQDRVRPKGAGYNFKPLEEVIAKWIKAVQS